MYAILLFKMQNLLKDRRFLGMLVSFMVASLLIAAFENEGPNHQPEAHHCVVCCASHSAAETLAQAMLQPPVLSAPYVPILTSLRIQPVIRQLDPIPKHPLA